MQRFPTDPRAGLLRAERLTQRGEREAARAEVRLVLSRGDTKPQMQQFVDFAGREPAIAPLLKRRGLDKQG